MSTRVVLVSAVCAHLMSQQTRLSRDERAFPSLNSPSTYTFSRSLPLKLVDSTITAKRTTDFLR